MADQEFRFVTDSTVGQISSSDSAEHVFLDIANGKRYNPVYNNRNQIFEEIFGREMTALERDASSLAASVVVHASCHRLTPFIFMSIVRRVAQGVRQSYPAKRQQMYSPRVLILASSGCRVRRLVALSELLRSFYPEVTISPLYAADESSARDSIKKRRPTIVVATPAAACRAIFGDNHSDSHPPIMGAVFWIFVAISQVFLGFADLSGCVCVWLEDADLLVASGGVAAVSAILTPLFDQLRCFCLRSLEARDTRRRHLPRESIDENSYFFGCTALLLTSCKWTQPLHQFVQEQQASQILLPFVVTNNDEYENVKYKKVPALSSLCLARIVSPGARLQIQGPVSQSYRNRPQPIWSANANACERTVLISNICPVGTNVWLPFPVPIPVGVCLVSVEPMDAESEWRDDAQDLVQRYFDVNLDPFHFGGHLAITDRQDIVVGNVALGLTPAQQNAWSTFQPLPAPFGHVSHDGRVVLSSIRRFDSQNRIVVDLAKLLLDGRFAAAQNTGVVNDRRQSQSSGPNDEAIDELGQLLADDVFDQDDVSSTGSFDFDLEGFDVVNKE